MIYDFRLSDSFSVSRSVHVCVCVLCVCVCVCVRMVATKMVLSSTNKHKTVMSNITDRSL